MMEYIYTFFTDPACFQSRTLPLVVGFMVGMLVGRRWKGRGTP